MYKAFLVLFCAVLFGSSSGQLVGQVTSSKSQPFAKIESPQIPLAAPAKAIPAAGEANREAQRLCQEGMKYLDAEQFSQAAESLQEAIRLDPDYADAYATLGRTYFKMRLWQKAIDKLQRAAALNTKQREAQDALYQKLTIEKLVPASPLQPTLSKQQEVTLQNANTTGLKTTHPTFGPTRQLERQQDPGAAPKSAPSSPTTKPTTDQRTASAVTQQLAKLNEDIPPLKSNDAPSAKLQEPVGARVSANESSRSAIVETRGVTPISIKAYTGDDSLTKVYCVGPSDVLDVRINESQPQQSTLFTVTPSGLLEHPMLVEPLNVSGLTTEEIETKIQDDLQKRALIANPKVIVGVRDYASHTILVSGLVKDSGTRFLRREAIPLYVVVADAQPLPEAARVTVVRNDQMYEIDLNQAADMGLLVRPGDVISIQPNVTQFIYIGGEVKSPGEKTFRRGLTLTQAIISAGGVSPKSKIAEIGRDDGRGFLVATRYKLIDIQTGKVIDPLMKPGDRVMILR